MKSVHQVLRYNLDKKGLLQKADASLHIAKLTQYILSISPLIEPFFTISHIKDTEVHIQVSNSIALQELHSHTASILAFALDSGMTDIQSLRILRK